MSSIDTSQFITSTGFDVDTIVDEIISAEKDKETTWTDEQSTIESEASALEGLETDLESLADSMSDLNDVTGVLATTTASSSDTSIVTATSNTSAASGTHSIVVTQLATTSTVYSSTLSSDATLSSGTLTFTVGGEEESVTIDDSTNTLSSLADSINSQDLGITASVVSDSNGERLVLVSNESGTDGEVDVTNSVAGLSFSTGTEAKNAELTIDGVSLEESSNTIDDAISGVTLTLTGTSSSSATVTVSPDTDGVKSAIEAFVDAYNTLIGDINTQCNYDSTKESTGVLSSDGAVTTLQQLIMSQTSYVSDTNSTYQTLYSLGITMGDDGTLALDSDTLESAISTNYSEVLNFFQNSTDGFATKFSSMLTDLTSSTAGVLNVDIQGLNNTYENLQDQIDDFEDRLDNERERLVTEYTKINAVLTTMQSNLDGIEDLLDSLDTDDNS